MTLTAIYVIPGAALIFALALVCAGQISSITVTLAGQTVSEGFIEWKFSVCITYSLWSTYSFFSYKLAFPSTTCHQMYQSNPFRDRSPRRWSQWDQCTTRCVTSCIIHRSSIRRFPSHLSDFN